MGKWINASRQKIDTISRVNQQIQPILSRLGQCYRALELVTGEKLNILE